MSTSTLIVCGGRQWGRRMHFRVLQSGSWELFCVCCQFPASLCGFVHTSAVSVVAREGSRFSPELELQGGCGGYELPDRDVGNQAQGLWKSRTLC